MLPSRKSCNFVKISRTRLQLEAESNLKADIQAFRKEFHCNHQFQSCGIRIEPSSLKWHDLPLPVIPMVFPSTHCFA